MEIKIFSRFDRPRSAFACAGSVVSPIFEERVDSEGHLYLKQTGKRDLNAFVQASHEASKIYNILERFNAGDVSAIQKVKGFYADTVAMPKSLVEVHNFMQQIDANFDSLPVDVKEKFGNSSIQFMKSVENGDLSKILSQFSSKNNVPKKVKKDGDN